MAASGRFRAADPDRAHCSKARVTFEIIVLQRRFGKVDIAICYPLQHP